MPLAWSETADRIHSLAFPVSMQKPYSFPRVVLFIILLTSLLAGFSAPTLENESVSAAPMRAGALDVYISEVAWGGTAANSADEWIELYNKTNSPINLSGWTLAADDGDPNITLTGTIPANGYYLLESGDDSTISDIIADQIYSSSLSNTGEVLRLKEGTSTIDTANNDGTTAWNAGSGSSTYFSMERDMPVGPDSATAWDSNNGIDRNGLDADGSPINGTPRNSQIDLSLTMSVLPVAPSVPSNIVFTVTISNNGLYTATNISVKDVFPTAGLTHLFNSASSGSYSIGTGFWIIPTLAGGATATLSITAQVTAVGVKTNRAEIWTVDQFDPDSTPGNGITTEDDYALAKATTPAAPTLNITNAVNNSNPNVGTNVVFTITVNNSSISPYPATNVNVAAPFLIDELNYISYSSSVGTYSAGSGIWTIGSLAIGASATINITAQVINSVQSLFLATVSSDEFISNTDTVIFNNPLSGEAALSLVQSLNPSSVTAGNVVLTLTVTNGGPDNATGVEVRDLLPAGLTFVSYTSTSGTTYSSSSGIWAVGTLASSGSGSSKILNLTVKAAPSGTSTTNFAEVWQSDQYDPYSTAGNGDQGEDDDSSVEVPVADLNLSESVDVSGSNAIFTVTVRNSGPDDATDVEVETSLPTLTSAYTFSSYGSTQGTYASASGVWDVGDLLDGESATLTITTNTAGSLLVNWVEVSASDQVDPDSVPNNNSRTEDDDAGAPSADLFLTHSVNSPNPDIGNNVIFTITVSNAGIAGTTNVQVKNILPSGLTYVSNDQGTAYSSSSGIWTVGTLASSGSGSTRTLNITAKVASIGIRTNWAEVWKSDESDPDSTPGNGSTTEDDDASATVTSKRAIIINEVAWMGTAASSSDEWIELYNPSNAPINISGWTLTSTSGSLNISLSGTISSGGYFLLERENNFTVSDVIADQIYTGALLNILLDSGEALTLRDGSTNIIDTANGNGGSWPKGGLSPNYGTMERQGTATESDTTWATNIGNPKNGKDANNGLIYGTPRRANSKGDAPAPTSTAPVPTTIPLVGRPIINEFLPRPGFDWNQDGKVNVYDEFIEVKNIGPVDISISGWVLDDEANLGSNPFTLPAITLKPGERKVFYGLQTNILLSDGGDTVRLLNPSGKIYDSYTYPIAKFEDQSVCRLPDGNGSWYEDCVPTPNLTNTRDGVVPSMPGGGVFESPVCELPDTLPADFLFAECRGYGANIWDSFYWDEFGWQGTQYIPENTSRWESFVE